MPTAAFQTPLVEQAIKARYNLQAGDEALKWCGINILLTLIFALRLGCLCVSSLVSLDPLIIQYGQYLELSLSAVCGVSAVCDVITYVSSRKFKEQLAALSPSQSLLLDIKSLARPAVCTCEEVSPTTPPSDTSLLGGSPSHHHHHHPTTPLIIPRPTLLEPFTPPLSTSMNSNSNLTLNTSLQSNSSFHSMSSISNSNLSFATPGRDGESPYHYSAAPRIRKRVSDINHLNEYLKEYEEKERWMSRGSSDRSLSSSGGWAPRPSETLPPRPYFLATQNQSVSVVGDTSHYNQQAADALVERLGIGQHSLDVWTENVRKWVSQTIFQHLHDEIVAINNTLEQVGSAECKIGSVSTAVLSKISANKHDKMSNIALLMPYLEVSVNQEYLVKRIQELASGSCLGCYRWESGGGYKNSGWNKELPTDSQIVMHCIATYLDSHLPRNPMYPEGRTFTTQYFVQTPSKAETKKRDYGVFQSSIHPPHFKLLVGEEVWEVSKGRNNLFHTLILLLHYLQEQQHGMLGPVNLGPTGLNLMWIISQ